MAKSCTLCTSSQLIQDRVTELAEGNMSLKKIEAILKQDYAFNISSSSIGRHLKECTQKRTDQEQVSMDVVYRLLQNPTDNEILNEALRTTLAQAALQCHQQILDNPDLEAFRGLEVLVNIRDKLYGETRETEQKPSEFRSDAYRLVIEQHQKKQ